MTVHDRYEIGDSICGQVDTATSLAKALNLARAHCNEHRTDNLMQIEIMDRMARRDCQSKWTVEVDGKQSPPKPSTPPTTDGCCQN